MQFEEDIPPCRSPRKSSRPPESLQKTRYATSRNPRNGAAILAVPRLNLRIFYPLTRLVNRFTRHPNRLGCESNGCFESGATRGSYRACAGNVPVGNMMPAPLKPSSQQKHTAVSMKKPNCRNPHPGENVRFRLTGTNLL